jgi:hypothetical protein
MADVEYRADAIALVNSVDNPIDVRLSTIKQVPEAATFGDDRRSRRVLIETENRFLQSFEPITGSRRAVGVMVR